MTEKPQTAEPTRPFMDRMLRRKEVEAITGRSRSAIYAGIDDGTFPKPIKIGTRAVAWPESVIRAWIAERMGEH
jgi:prophage regulatory protein